MEEYIYYNSEEIITLKKNLMEHSHSSSQSNCYPKSLSDAIRQIKNEEIELIFEKNLRNLLQTQLQWKIGEIPRKFNYREIEIGEIIKIFTAGKSEDITIGADIYKFSMLQNESIEIKNIDGNENTFTVPKKEQMRLKFSKKINVRIFISEIKNIEIDGSFQINNFDLNSFDPNEVVVLYKGIKNINDFNTFNYIVMEAKLNPKKLLGMINQLKKDKFVIEKLYKKKVLYIGFINSAVLEIDISKEITDINFLILGIKYSQLFKRAITEFYDWKLINSIEMSIDNINKKIDVMSKKIEAISQKCDNIGQKYENMNQKYGIMRQTYESMSQKYDTINKKVDFLETLITNKKEKDVIRVELLNKKRNQPD